MRLEVSIESRLDAMTDKHKQSVIANEYRNCEQETYELLFCIIAYNTLSRLKSSDDVSDDENAKENLVKVMSRPNLPMWYRKNVNLHILQCFYLFLGNFNGLRTEFLLAIHRIKHFVS